MRRITGTLALIFLQIAAAAPSFAEQAPLTVFAAASTQQAVEAVLKTCPAEISRPCRGVFAASSTLARQISGGAPADIYISANLKWMRYLVDNNLVPEARVTVLASNRLVAIAPKPHEIAIANEQELADWLGRDRVAIGDPAHVPAGIYAEQALQALGIWQALQGHMLRMPNVRAALAVVARAEANAGIVYATDVAVSGDVKIVYRFDASLHAPIRYPMAPVSGRESPDTDKLLALFLSDTGKMAFKAAGFEVAAD